MLKHSLGVRERTRSVCSFKKWFQGNDKKDWIFSYPWVNSGQKSADFDVWSESVPIGTLDLENCRSVCSFCMWVFREKMFDSYYQLCTLRMVHFFSMQALHYSPYQYVWSCLLLVYQQNSCTVILFTSVFGSTYLLKGPLLAAPCPTQSVLVFQDCSKKACVSWKFE